MTETAASLQAKTDTDAGASLSRALVAAILYYTPVTILSLAQLDLPRLLMMALYLLPFVAVPLVGLWRMASHQGVAGHALALSR